MNELQWSIIGGIGLLTLLFFGSLVFISTKRDRKKYSEREKDHDVQIVFLIEEHTKSIAELIKSHEGVFTTIRLLYSDLMTQALKEQYLTFHRTVEVLREDLKASRGQKPDSEGSK